MRKRTLIWGLMCLTLAAITSVCTILVWVYGADGYAVLISNLAWILNLPVWTVLFVIVGPGIRTDPLWITIACLIGCTLWCLFACIVLRVGSRRERSVPSAETDGFSIQTGRRAFIARSTLGGLGVAAVSSASYATLVAPWQLKARHYTIRIPGLSKSLEGLRIVHVSDTHLGPRIPANFIVDAYRAVTDLAPDLIVHTGDHVHDGVEEIDEAAAMCRVLAEGAPLGAIGTLGNHDWWGDAARLSAALTASGMRMIDNDRVFLTSDRRLVTEQPTDGLAIVGLGDLTDDEVLVNRAFSGLHPNLPRLVLAHNPDTAEIDDLTNPDAPRVDLMLSGHTHGGQVRLPFLGTPIVPSRYGQKYAGGLVDGPSFRVLVSRGVGMSLLPVRVGVPPEISVIVLQA